MQGINTAVRGLSLLLLILPGILAQCPQPSYENIKSLLLSHVVNITQIEEDSVGFELVDHTLSCLSTSGVRNAYQYATVVVFFQTNTVVLDCTETDDCIGYFHIVCSQLTSEWILNEDDVSLSLELDDDAPLNMTEPRTDCGVCSHDSFFNDTSSPEFQALFDNETHCYSKLILLLA